MSEKDLCILQLLTEYVDRFSGACPNFMAKQEAMIRPENIFIVVVDERVCDRIVSGEPSMSDRRKYVLLVMSCLCQAPDEMRVYMVS